MLTVIFSVFVAVIKFAWNRKRRRPNRTRNRLALVDHSEPSTELIFHRQRYGSREGLTRGCGRVARVRAGRQWRGMAGVAGTGRGAAASSRIVPGYRGISRRGRASHESGHLGVYRIRFYPA